MHAVAEIVVSALLCVSAVAGTPGSVSAKSETTTPEQPRHVYFDGKLVEMRFAPGRSTFVLGGTGVKAQVSRDKPKDPHPNFYIVAPGAQYTQPGQEEYAHNEVVSVIPITENALEWDVYYAVVLDPALKEDFHSEQELILATQQDFEPGPEFQFEEIPGAAYLRTYLKIGSLEELESYRRSDGKLPRLIIVPGKLTVKAVVVDPEGTQGTETNKQVSKPALSEPQGFEIKGQQFAPRRH